MATDRARRSWLETCLLSDVLRRCLEAGPEVAVSEQMPTPRTSDSSPLRVAAVTLGADDADTVATVTGQLAGALYGLRGIPDRWLDRLAWKDRLIDAGERLLSASLR